MKFYISTYQKSISADSKQEDSDVQKIESTLVSLGADKKELETAKTTAVRYDLKNKIKKGMTQEEFNQVRKEVLKTYKPRSRSTANKELLKAYKEINQ